ncbi:MAG: glycosyltransferase family 4 protein [Bacteroides sp.]|nr:glycosyltransferase family 4 protein [Bacteroides sp.]MCM1380230.1 glycosyltransferase family 4 protein [Bacteroides sp.]MCM1446538.1 glycosyltransferase family 4 protein [Prevotella sp.]
MKDNNSSDNIFSKVLTIGPSRKGIGGISTVLRTYKELIPDLQHLPSNSPKGTLAGLLIVLKTLLMMPIERLRGRSILHVHVASGKSYIRKSCIISWGKFLGYKVIYHCHGGHTQEYFRKIGIPRAKRTLDKCASIVCLSKTWQRYFDSTFHHPDIRIIHNPIIPSHVITHPNEKHPLELLYLGYLTDAKGIFDLLEVFLTHRDRWIGRVKLTVAGNGEEERLKNFIRENRLGELITFIGCVDGEEKERLFAQHHVLILPSYVECLPMSILEAMGHGMPVISTPVGGIPEMILPGENGILFNPGDKDAMSAAIDCYLLNPELIDRHGKAALKIIPDFYPGQIKADLKKLYSEL